MDSVGCKVIDLLSFKTEKKLGETMARGRTPLYQSYRKSAEFDSGDFPARMQKIRESLEKINLLMTQLKQNGQAH